MSLESKQQDLSMLKAMLWSSDHMYLMQKAILGDAAAVAALQAKQDEITTLETEIAALETA
tara:strand:+ start:52 stop:234 length:183 start_codon:yes stop_codon:yes gene_type:complete